MEPLHWQRIDGPADRPALVFLHHGLGSVAQWRDFPRRLANLVGAPALVYDRRGHGQSPRGTVPRSSRYHFEEAAALGDLLQDLAISDAILVGHSDGGSMALLYPAVTGKQPRAIVCLAAHAFVEPRTRAGIRAVMQDWRQTMLPRLERYHGTKAEELVLSWSGVWLSPSFDAFDIRGELEAIRCPVFAVQGELDEYGSGAQLEAIGRHARARTALIPGSGHEPHLEAADVTLGLLGDWIRRDVCRDASS